MTLIRWEPVAELATIQSEMNRLFNTLFEQPGQAARGDSAAARWTPAMDLVETGEHYVLRADLPGLAQDDVTIELESNALTVSGERKPEHSQHEEGYYRVERAFGPFSRTLTLPEGVNAAAIEAAFERGVLEIRIPKPEQRKPHKVTITTSETEPKAAIPHAAATAAQVTDNGELVGAST
jgi:HSP20 family protein